MLALLAAGDPKDRQALLASIGYNNVAGAEPPVA